MNTGTELAHENDNTAIERIQPQALQQAAMEMSPEVFEARIEREGQMRKILKDYVKANMVEGHHFSNKLGTLDLPKPMLLQEGTRNICSLFKLFFGNPVITETYHEGGHYRARTHIALYNAEGRQISSGDAVCSTYETKYGYRIGQRVCPSCGVAAIFKDNKSDAGGFYCWAKKDGCGAKFAANDTAITEQKTGRVDNPDKADIENTVLKMSVKRAKTAAVCDVAMVSEIFAPEDEASNQRSAVSSQKSQQKPAATASSSKPPVSADVEPGQAGSVKTAVDLAYKLQKDHGVDAESLVMQFLPEGVAKFSDLTEDQAAEAVPGLSELLNGKLAAAKA